MFVRSNDIVLMAGEARECFHGVPMIFTSSDHADTTVLLSHFSDETDLFFRDYIRTTRINISISAIMMCLFLIRRCLNALGLVAKKMAVPAMSRGEEFQTEAALFNYFGPSDMLGGHLDGMEKDLSKPVSLYLADFCCWLVLELSARHCGDRLQPSRR